MIPWSREHRDTEWAWNRLLKLETLCLRFCASSLCAANGVAVAMAVAVAVGYAARHAHHTHRVSRAHTSLHHCTYRTS